MTNTSGVMAIVTGNKKSIDPHIPHYFDGREQISQKVSILKVLQRIIRIIISLPFNMDKKGCSAYKVGVTIKNLQAVLSHCLFFIKCSLQTFLGPSRVKVQTVVGENPDHVCWAIESYIFGQTEVYRTQIKWLFQILYVTV